MGIARSTKDEVKALMKGLDLQHIKYIHIWVNNQFIENDSRLDDMFDDENRYYGHLGDFGEWYVQY